MSSVPTPANSALFGNKEHLGVSRALSELQARRPIRVDAPGEVLFALPVEGLEEQRLREFAVLRDANEIELIVTRHRARAIGIEASTPMALPLARATNAGVIFDLASGGKSHFTAKAVTKAVRSGHKIVTLKASAGETS